MARVFVSHADEDGGLAAELHAWLVDNDHEVFLDRDLRDGIQPGEEWEKRLYERLRWADATLCVISSAYVDSAWCTAEVIIARLLGGRLLPLRAERGVSHPLLRSAQWVDYAGDPGGARAALVHALRQVDAAGGMGWPDGRSPYPGLRAFDVDMHRVFFGRDADVDALAALLRSPATAVDRQLLVVVGPSGCGKSSLVRAGLLPTMAQEDEWWPIAPFFPGVDPAAALAGELAAAGRRLGTGWTPDQVRERLDGHGGLVAVAQELLVAASGGGRRRRSLLVVVDQLEELLTQTPASARARFVDLLTPALARPVYVVATLGPELLPDLLANPELLALPVRPFPLRPLRREALPEVVEGPARLAGIGIDAPLVARLVADADTGEALPLLAFALSQLADGVGRGGRLSMGRYEELGGVQGALRHQADAALAAACAAGRRGRDDVIAGLLRLVTVDENGQPIRWHVNRAELSETVLLDLDAFISRRLVTTDVDASGAVQIGLTHASFLSAWPPLADAISKAASGLRMRRQVEQSAVRWEQARHPRSRLWSGDQLASARADLGARLRPARSGIAGRLLPGPRSLTVEQVELSPRARDFMVASMRRERHRRTRERTILSAALAVLLVLASVAFAQRQAAVEQQREATRQQRIATARELTIEASDLRDSRPDVSLMLNVESLGLGRSSSDSDSVVASRDARAGLLATLLQSHYAGTLRGHAGGVYGVAYSPDGQTLAAGTADGTALLWDVRSPTPPARPAVTLSGHTGSVYGVAYSPDGSTLATAGADHTVILWDLDSPTFSQLTTLRGHTDAVSAVAYSPVGHTLVTAGFDRTAVLWDLVDRTHPAPIATLRGHSDAVSGVAWAPDGRTLATASADGTAMLWDLGDPAHPVRLATLGGHAGAVLAVAFGPDGRTLVTTSADRTAFLWDVGDRARPVRLSTLSGHTGAVLGVAYGPDGRTLATASSDGTAVLWDVGDPQRPTLMATLSGHTDGVLGVAYGRGGALATASLDGTSILWDLADRAHPARLGTLSGHAGAVTGVAYGRGDTLATASADHSAILWDVRDRTRPVPMTRLSDHTGGVYGVAYSRDDSTLATASADHTAILWDLDNPTHPRLTTLTGHTDAVSAVAYSPDGHTLATASFDRTAVLWDVGDRMHPAHLATLSAHRDTVSGVAFSPDGRMLATASADGMTILWDIRARAHPGRLGTLSGQSGSVNGVAFSPDGRTLATANSGDTAILWDVASPAHPARLATLSGHADKVLGVTYSRDGSTLATVSSDGTAILWDVGDPANPNRLARLSGHTGSVDAVSFSPGDDTLTTAGSDGTAILWDVGGITSAAADPVRLACTIAGPGLSRSDWSRYVPGVPYEQRICP